MRYHKKMLKTACTALFFMVFPIMTGCGSSSQEAESGDFRVIVDEYASVYLPMDEDGYIYETALDTVGDYLSGNAASDETLAEVESTIDELYERLAGIEDYDTDSEFGALLEEYDIIPEEFEAFANYRSVDLQSYAIDLETVAMYLEYAEVYEYDYEQVVFWHELLDAILEAEKGYYYYGCQNYWFAGWDEEQLAYVDEKATSELQSYISDSFYWEEDRDVAEQLAMRYLDTVDEYLSLEAEHLAQVSEDYATLRKELEELKKMIEENEGDEYRLQKFGF